MVGVYINTVKKTLDKLMISIRFFSSIFFKSTGKQRETVKYTTSLCFNVYMYPCCMKAWQQLKFKSKVMFIVLIYTTTTVNELLTPY